LLVVVGFSYLTTQATCSKVVSRTLEALILKDGDLLAMGETQTGTDKNYATLRL
jgi:hypothetical protein